MTTAEKEQFENQNKRIAALESGLSKAIFQVNLRFKVAHFGISAANQRIDNIKEPKVPQEPTWDSVGLYVAGLLSGLAIAGISHML